MKRAGIARLVIVALAIGITLLGALVITPMNYALAKTAKPSESSTPVHKNAAKSQPAAKGVVAKFARAMAAYNQGNFSNALVQFDAIYKAYPAHEPTIIQYAKTLYRLDRIPESYNLFARVNPQYLDFETAYEYGYSFYVNNKFEPALFSFKRVPQEHPLYDLANYYAAMCSIRLKKYADAEDHLDKAVVLPDKLARSKSLYQKHVASLRQLQEKSEIEKATQAEKQRISQESVATPAVKSPSAKSNDPVEEQKKEYDGIYTVLSEAKLRAIQNHQSSDLHGHARRTYTSKTGTFIFNRGAMTLFPKNTKIERQTAAGIQIKLAASSITTEGVQERLVASESSRDIVQNLSERLPSITTNNGDIGGSLWIETPIADQWRIGADGHLSFTYPNFARGQRYGIRGATGNLRWKSTGESTSEVKFGGTYDLIFDSETQPVTSQTITEASYSWSIEESFTFKASCKYIFYNYMLPILPGPDTSTSGTIDMTKHLPLGVSLKVGGTIEQQQNYIARDLGSFESAAADGTIQSGYAKLDISPIKFINIGAQHTRSKSVWNVRQSDRVDAFKAKTPNYTETTDFTASVNLVF